MRRETGLLTREALFVEIDLTNGPLLGAIRPV